MRWLATFALLGGCFEGGGSNGFDCAAASASADPHCRVAVGADTYLVGIRTEMDGRHLQSVDSATVAPAGLIELTRLDESTFVAHALATGTVELTAVVDGDARTGTIEAVAGRVGKIAVDGLPEALLTRPDKLAVFHGSHAPLLTTSLVDEAGDEVGGFGLEHWSPEDRLAEPTPGLDGGVPEIDWSLYPTHPLSRVVSITAQPVSVSNGGDTLAFVEASPGDTDHFDVVPAHSYDVPIMPPFTLGVRGTVSQAILPWTADATLLVGDAIEVQVSSDSASARVSSDARTFSISGVSVGHATVTVSFDGLAKSFDVIVQ